MYDVDEYQRHFSTTDVFISNFLFVTVGLSGENVAMESILPIVASQRERFKIRNMELEAVSKKRL